MKRLLLYLIAFFPLVTHAQFKQGDKFVGGALSLTSQRSLPNSQGVSTTTNSFTISPMLGILLSKNVAIGAKLGYGRYNWNSMDRTDSSYSSQTSYAAGILARRYFTISDKFLFSLDGNLGFARTTNAFSNDNNHDVSLYYELGINIVPSFLFFPSSRWSLEASIGSIGFMQNRDLTNDVITNRFNLDYRLLTLGLVYYFRKTD